MYVSSLVPVKKSTFLLPSDYVPCTTPLNMTITLDDRPELPLHPLDLTAEPPQDNQAQFCIGIIQAADAQLSSPGSSLGDMILGVPFLRNVYTVMAYTAPETNGSFTPVNGSNQTITPRLGLLSLTNSTTALEEFYAVRGVNQPISGGGSGNPAGGPLPVVVSLGGKKLSVGIVVLIGILSFFALCFVLFVARWFMFRRKYRDSAEEVSAGTSSHTDREEADEVDKKSSKTEVYMFCDKTTSSTIGNDGYTGIEEKKRSDSITLAIVGDVEDEYEVRMEDRGKTKDVEWDSLTVAGGDNTVYHQQNLKTPVESDSSPVFTSSSLSSALNPPSQAQQPPAPEHPETSSSLADSRMPIPVHII